MLRTLIKYAAPLVFLLFWTLGGLPTLIQQTIKPSQFAFPTSGSSDCEKNSDDDCSSSIETLALTQTSISLEVVDQSGKLFVAELPIPDSSDFLQKVHKPPELLSA